MDAASGACASDPTVARTRTKHKKIDSVCLFNVPAVIDFLLGAAPEHGLQGHEPTQALGMRLSRALGAPYVLSYRVGPAHWKKS